MWCHPPDLSLNLKDRVVSQDQEYEVLDLEVWLIGVSASSWSPHAERDPHWNQGKGLASLKHPRVGGHHCFG